MKNIFEQNKYVITIIIGAIIIAGAIYIPKSPTPSKLQTENSNYTANSSLSTGTNCFIKGNINSKKEKIYHLPGCGSYDKTVITESAGEKWFCNESEALAASWRKAKNCP